MMRIEFTKMHGCGNDYIYVDCTKGELLSPGEISAAMSPRHFSVGADGLVMICRSDTCDFKMRMFNLDGSEGNMCGNAIRCVGKYVYDNGMTDKRSLSIETKSGVKYLTLFVKDGSVESVTVDMGTASTSPESLPMRADSEMINAPVTINEKEYRITAVSMGNPHQVIYCESPESLELEKIGHYFENFELFPERVNTEFVKVVGKNRLKMRVWERGSGETFACGTGACAAVVASVLNGYFGFDEPVTVELVGGELTVTVRRDMRVFMTGPCVKVYEGVYYYGSEN